MDLCDAIPPDIIKIIFDLVINIDNERTIFALFQVSKRSYKLTHAIARIKYKQFSTTSNKLLLSLYPDIETINISNNNIITYDTLNMLTNLRSLSIYNNIYDYDGYKNNLTELIFSGACNDSSHKITDFIALKSLRVPSCPIYLTTLTNLQKLQMERLYNNNILSVVNIENLANITDLHIGDTFSNVSLLLSMNLTSLSISANEQLPYLPFLTKLQWNTTLEVNINHTLLRELKISKVIPHNPIISIEAPLLEKLTVHFTHDMISLTHLMNLTELHWHTTTKPRITSSNLVTYHSGEYNNEEVTVLANQTTYHFEGVTLTEHLTHVTYLDLYDCTISANTMSSLTNLTKLHSRGCEYFGSLSCLTALCELHTDYDEPIIQDTFNINHCFVDSLSKLQNLTWLRSDIVEYKPVRRMNIEEWCYT